MVGKSRAFHTIPYCAFERTHGRKTTTWHVSLPLDCTHRRMTSSVACFIVLGLHTRRVDVGRGMPLYTLGSTCDRTTSGVACYHRPWKAHMIGLRQPWHARMILWQHTWSNDVGHGNPSSQLCSTLGRTTYRVACPLWPLASTHS